MGKGKDKQRRKQRRIAKRQGARAQIPRLVCAQYPNCDSCAAGLQNGTRVLQVGER
jgi:hypothetical protein